MATNYNRGRAKEYYNKQKLEKQGYIVIRASGSHGFADLVAVDLKNKKIRFIQAKPRKMSDNAKAKLEEEHKAMNDEFLCTFEVV